MPAIHSITVPKWGLSMEKGRLTAWHRQVGDRVSPGDEICDIETDKISGGLEVNVGGVLRRQLAQEGDELPVGALVAVVADAEAAGTGSLEELAAVVAGLTERLGVASGRLVGNSLGGAVALAMASSTPKRVRSLSLICRAGVGREINAGYVEGFVRATTRNA